jgi:hypothetical protein
MPPMVRPRGAVTVISGAGAFGAESSASVGAPYDSHAVNTVIPATAFHCPATRLFVTSRASPALKRTQLHSFV